MDNQHREIKGYRELSQEEIDLMNEIKTKAKEVGALVKKLYAPNYDSSPDGPIGEANRWVSIGKTSLQQGFMALTRAVAKPDFF